MSLVQILSDLQNAKDSIQTTVLSKKEILDRIDILETEINITVQEIEQINQAELLISVSPINQFAVLMNFLNIEGLHVSLKFKDGSNQNFLSPDKTDRIGEEREISFIMPSGLGILQESAYAVAEVLKNRLIRKQTVLIQEAQTLLTSIQ